MAYVPSRRVIRSLSAWSGVSLDAFSRLHLRSKNESRWGLAVPSTKRHAIERFLYGKWCGMPAPPEHEDAYGRPVGARTFWEASDHFGACEKRASGMRYEERRLLQRLGVRLSDERHESSAFQSMERTQSPKSKGPCGVFEDTKGSYAVLGIAALNHGVCYPSHVHDNQAGLCFTAIFGGMNFFVLHLRVIFAFSWLKMSNRRRPIGSWVALAGGARGRRISARSPINCVALSFLSEREV